MTSLLSIDRAFQRNFGQSLKDAVGAAVSTIFQERADELFQSPTNSPTGFRDKAIMAWLKRRALKEDSTDFFERLHLDFWSAEGGSEYSSNCDHRFNDLFLKRQAEDFEALKETWSQFNLKQIVEFGCNSGLLLQYLTTNLEGVLSSTGIDINQTQIEANQSSSRFDSRIDFRCEDAAKWINENGLPATLFVTNGGVLEYFSRQRLDSMLSHISNDIKPAIFFASEPVAADHDWDATTESVPFGEELSFSHNYRDLFESNGFEVVHSRAVEFDQWKMIATIAVSA